MDLYIAEKPSLAEAIAAALPGTSKKTRTHIEMSNGTVLTWCFGHLLEQVKPEEYDAKYASWRLDDLPILPTNWKLHPVAKTASQLAAIKSFLPNATRIVHAGDPDQEGQLIVDEVLAYLRNTKPVMRILVNDYNNAKVKQAIAGIQPNTGAQFRGWSHWALCRSRLDWMFGMNLSRAYTLKAREGGYESVLSVGRVQTPTLAIIVARDNAIDGFKSIPFYALTASVEAKGVAFQAAWKAKEGQPGLDEQGRLTDLRTASELQARLSAAPAVVSSFEATAKTRSAPLPFYIDTLQMAANDRFGYTAAQTLEAAQSLYETHKLTTYPRSDCPYLSRDQHAETPGRLKAIAAVFPGLAGAVAGADASMRGPAFNDEKVTAHHGIVPTANERGTTVAALNERERNIYELIAANFVAQFYPPEQYEQTAIALDIGGERFTASGKRVTSPGWTAVFSDPSTEEVQDDEQEGAGQSLPRLAKGEAVANRGVRAISRKTTPPPRFTEKLLLKAMANVHALVTNPAAKARLKEGQGIGTPATRANIIEELKRREYVSAKGKQLISTPAARAFVAALPAVATDAGFTGITEQTLDQVAAGKISPADFLAKSGDLIRTLVTQASRAALALPTAPKIPCPECKTGELKRRKGSKGYFWGCTGYKDGCKASFDDNRGKPKTGAKTGSGARKPAAKKSAARGKGSQKVAKSAGRSMGMDR